MKYLVKKKKKNELRTDQNFAVFSLRPIRFDPSLRGIFFYDRQKKKPGLYQSVSVHVTHTAVSHLLLQGLHELYILPDSVFPQSAVCGIGLHSLITSRTQIYI